MNLQRIDKMLGEMLGWDKDKTKVIISFLEPATAEEMDAARAIAETHGWKTIEVQVTPKPCTGISVNIKYINPEDEPKMEPGKIYA